MTADEAIQAEFRRLVESGERSLSAYQRRRARWWRQDIVREIIRTARAEKAAIERQRALQRIIVV